MAVFAKRNKKGDDSLPDSSTGTIGPFYGTHRPRQLLIRIKPTEENKTTYAAALIEVIEQEYQHNVTQQIYVSDECWKAIKTSKNITINMIRNLSVDQGLKTADQLRKKMLIMMEEQEPPSSVGLQFIKREAAQMW